MIKNAIFHVENTENVLEFAEYLASAGWTILSANETEELLRKNKIPVVQEPALVENKPYRNDISQLVRRIVSARADDDNAFPYTSVEKENSINLLCINFYPSLNKNVSSHQLKEAIQPFSYSISYLLRSAFVNYENVLLITDPADYKEAMIQLKTNNVTDEFRLYLAGKALNLISAFDAGVAATILQNPRVNVEFMNYLTHPYILQAKLKKGMNLQQNACVYKLPSDEGIFSGISKLYAEDLSYTMVSDVSMAWELISNLYNNLKNQFTVKSTNCDGYDFTTQFTPLTGTVFTVAVKYKKIIGAAVSTSVLDSFNKTYLYDSENIDDVTLASSAVIDEAAAQKLVQCKFSAIVAPGFTAEAQQILEANKSIHLIPTSKINNSPYIGQNINGGILLQKKDSVLFDHWNVKTKNRPSQFKIDEMALGVLLTMETPSYSAIVVTDNSIVGIAQGCLSMTQAMGSLLYETDLCARRNNRELICDVFISDAPIPFNDTTKKLLDLGITAIIQPGGASTDKEFIEYCDERGIVMVFTGMTHINY